MLEPGLAGLSPVKGTERWLDASADVNHSFISYSIRTGATANLAGQQLYSAL